MIGFIKCILKLPKCLCNLLIKFIICLLNIIPLPKITICSSKSFCEYLPSYDNSIPKRYFIELPLQTIHLGNFLVAYFRNYFQKRELFEIQKIVIKTAFGERDDHKIICKKIKKSILDTDLQEIINDFKIIYKN